MEVSCTKICLVPAENPVKYVKFSIFQGAPFLEKDIVKKLDLYEKYGKKNVNMYQEK